MSTAMSPISKWKNNKFCTSSALFFTTCTNTTVKKFSFATLFGGRKHRDNFNFFADSELGCGPSPRLRKGSSPIFAILRECTKKKPQKSEKNKAKQKTRIHFDGRLGTFPFPTLAVVLAKAFHSQSCNIRYPVVKRVSPPSLSRTQLELRVLCRFPRQGSLPIP